ncbi:MAG TPA: FeoC-like transcriptional regulator [Guyparkeria sp.]|nr:FeoC-like transcriptional regulator [Guyparkeria sp.]
MRQRGAAPKRDLVYRFDAPPALIDDLLDFWMRRGRVQCMASHGGCRDSTCGGCAIGADAGANAGLDTWYGWLDSPQVVPLDVLARKFSGCLSKRPRRDQ